MARGQSNQASGNNLLFGTRQQTKLDSSPLVFTQADFARTFPSHWIIKPFREERIMSVTKAEQRTAPLFQRLLMTSRGSHQFASFEGGTYDLFFGNKGLVLDLKDEHKQQAYGYSEFPEPNAPKLPIRNHFSWAADSSFELALMDSLLFSLETNQTDPSAFRETMRPLSIGEKLDILEQRISEREQN